MVWQNAVHETPKEHKTTQVYGSYSETDLSSVLPPGAKYRVNPPFAQPFHEFTTLSETAYHYHDDDFRFYNAGTCPECGSGMVRSGACFSCPACGFGSCSG